MSVIRGRGYRQRKNRNSVGHGDESLTMLVPPQRPRKVARATHDRLTGRDRAQNPLTANQQAVLAVLTPEPQRCADIARRAGINPRSVPSALYALASKNLAEGPLHGWRLPAQEKAV